MCGKTVGTALQKLSDLHTERSAKKAKLIRADPHDPPHEEFSKALVQAQVSVSNLQGQETEKSIYSCSN